MVYFKSESYAGHKIFFEKDKKMNRVIARWLDEREDIWNSVFAPTKEEAFEGAKRIIDSGGSPMRFHLSWNPMVYGSVPDRVVFEDFFTDSRGFGSEEREAILSLRVGHTWEEEHALGEGLTVRRID